MRAGSRILLPAMLLTLGVPGTGRAQDTNILLSADSVEYLLRQGPFQLPDTLVGMRFDKDRTQRVPLYFEDGTAFLVKWAEAP
ncbi:MAG TPA: hypothetical protein VE173_13285, partial [Longimicrobiales bacterium]|nr:hypothetical protein [Longimicrobiales bacterium]